MSKLQKAKAKIYKSRQIEESLLTWINGKGSTANYYEYLKANAVTLLGGTSFNQALYNGFNAATVAGGLSYTGGDAAKAASSARSEKVDDLTIRFRELRRKNHFRLMLEELFE